MTDEEKAEDYVIETVCGYCNRCETKGYVGCDTYRLSKKAYLDGLAEGRKETIKKIVGVINDNNSTYGDLRESLGIKWADTDLEKENAELKAQIDKMKCCGNCKHWHHEGIQKYCVATKPDFLIKRQKEICDKWEQAE